MTIKKLALVEFVEMSDELADFLSEADITSREGYLKYYLTGVAARLRTIAAVINQVKNGVVDNKTATNFIYAKIEDLKAVETQLQKTGDNNYINLIKTNIAAVLEALSSGQPYTPIYPQGIVLDDNQIAPLVKAELAKLRPAQAAAYRGPQAKVDHWVTAPTPMNPKIDLNLQGQ